MTAPIADEMHKLQTVEFIKQNPVEIQLRRRPLESDLAGGRARGDEANIPAQTVRLVGQGAATRILSPDGDTVLHDFTLVAEADANVERDDLFDIGDTTYRVVGKPDRSPPWGTRAGVRVEAN